jgi:hypothetical protein
MKRLTDSAGAEPGLRNNPQTEMMLREDRRDPMVGSCTMAAIRPMVAAKLVTLRKRDLIRNAACCQIKAYPVWLFTSGAAKLVFSIECEREICGLTSQSLHSAIACDRPQ